MRDLINLIQNLSEAAVGMSANEIKKYEWRFKKFLEKIEKGEPFTTVDGTEVTIDPYEANRFFMMYHVDDNFTGAIKAKTTDGGEIPLSKLAKTTEFGGAAVSAGQDVSTGGKEGLIVKPSQIGICDQNINAADFYDVIANNTVLASTEYGRVVQSLAQYIISGEYVMLPEEYQGKEKEKVRKAIVDYAGEYLGVLALLYGRSVFPQRGKFEEWLGASIEELVLNFPSKANTNLADSYATITNPSTSHTLNISSKGTGGGAAPALSGLKIPEHVKSDPNLSDAVRFIEICQTEGTLQQAFSAMDLVYQVNPKSLDKKWHKYLPFSEKSPGLHELCKKSIASGKTKNPIGLPAKYAPLWRDIKGAGTEGGKVVYAIKKEVQNAINTRDGIPDFETAVLEILEMNFVQQYADYKNGEIAFATQWPAKLDGKISVENKASSTEPTAGGFSFKLGRVDNSVSSEPGEPEVDAGPDEYGDDVEVAAAELTGGPAAKPTKKDTSPVGDVGRMKRK